jgi:hypothetical protein
MTPRRLLRLWRERWGKGSDDLPDRPYQRGAVHAWMHRLPRSQLWSWPMLSGLMITLSALFIFFAVQIEYSLNGQITFGAILVGMALFARRFAGHLFTLVLINLGGVAAISYFHWRLSKTLVFRNRTELLLSMALCLIEIAGALYLTIRAVNLLWPLSRASRGGSGNDDPRPRIDVVTSAPALHHRQPPTTGDCAVRAAKWRGRGRACATLGGISRRDGRRPTAPVKQTLGK